MNNFLLRNDLLFIHKLFVRAHVDFRVVFYHQPNNESMNSKLDIVRCSAALAITGAIKKTSGSKLYKELGLESLKSRRTFRCLFVFFHFIKLYLHAFQINCFDLIPKSCHGYQTRTLGSIAIYQCGTDTFKHSFFTWTILKWKKIHPETWNAFLTVFKKHLLKEICPVLIQVTIFAILMAWSN